MSDLKKAQLAFFDKQDRDHVKDAEKARSRPVQVPRPSSTVSEPAVSKSFSVADYRPKKETPVLRQMHNLVDFLKRERKAMSASDIFEKIGVDPQSQGLQLHIAQNPRLKYDITSGLYSYRALYEATNLEELAALALNKTEGMLREELESAYPGAKEDVETLIDNRTLTMIRNPENHLDVLFGNRMSSVQMVDPDVLQLWESVGIKEGAAIQEIESMLKAAGLQPTRVQGDDEIPMVTKIREKKMAGKRTRKIKLTNTHLQDVDYDLNEEVPEAAKKAKPIPR